MTLAATMAYGQQAAPQSWLHPSAQEYAKAIADGYSSRSLPKKDRYQVLDFNGGGFTGGEWSITVTPPLTCAVDSAARAYKALAPEPTDKDVTGLCDGALAVTVVHESSALNSSWPVVLVRGGQTTRPNVSTPDADPDVVNYQTVVGGSEVGYQYIDIYIFRLDEAWAESADLVYADDSGKHHVLHCDFKKFIGAERKRRS